MNHISSWAIKRPIPPILFFLIITIAGLLAFRALPINNNPNVDLPTVSVMITDPGATPNQIEGQITRRVEAAIGSVAGVKHVQSVITSSVSATTVEFRLETPTDRALSDVRDAVTRIRSDLPRTVGEPIISRVNASGAAILTFAVDLPGRTLDEQTWFVDDVIARRLRAIAGVGAVNRFGGADREILIQIDPAPLAALGATAQDVNAQIRALNSDFASGSIKSRGGDVLTIETQAGARQVEDLRQATITLAGGRPVRLGDFATITDAAAQRTEVTLLGGKPVVGFEVQRARGASEVAVAETVENTLQAIRSAHPEASITKVATTVDQTLESYHAGIEELIIGCVLAVIVVFAFLRDWRSTMIAAVALPLSIIPTFAVMQMLGFSLNIISLLALTLSVGILVDDAIVEVENIIRHSDETGDPPYASALAAADEIGLAVVATTASLIAVFVPVSAMSGVAGQYFREFGLTVAIAVAFSLLVARLITPLMAAYLLRPRAAKEEAHGPLTIRYGQLLAWALEHRGLMLGAAGLVVAATVALTPFLKSGFVPNLDVGRADYAVMLPPGAGPERAEAAALSLTTALQQSKAVDNVFVRFGGASAGEGGGAAASGSDLSRGSMTVMLKPRKKRGMSLSAFLESARPLLAAVPDVQVGSLNNGLRDVSILLVGDTVELVTAAQQVADSLRTIPGLANVTTTAPPMRQDVVIRPHLDLAASMGVTAEAIAAVARSATVGAYPTDLPTYDAGDRQIAIRARLSEDARFSLDALKTLPVPTATGGAVPLSAVADVGYVLNPARIERFDRARRIVIEADLDGVESGEALAAINALAIFQSLPPGVERRQFGNEESQTELFGQFGIALGTGLALMYLVLALLFRDLLHPITIMMALPLSLFGAMAALIAFGRPIDLPASIGILMLMGIVAKNSILLVELAIERKRAGRPQRDALIEAGMTRARPIIMTTVAMVAGMVLPALGIGHGAELRSSMALVVIGGLLASTLLSLVFIPTFFSLVDDFDHWIGPRLARLTTRAPGDETPSRAAHPRADNP